MGVLGRTGSVRAGLGISLQRVSEWAGISVPTVRLFEADPMRVTPNTRYRCERVYEVLDRALRELQKAG